MTAAHKKILSAIFLLSFFLNCLGVGVNLPSAARSKLIIPDRATAEAFADVLVTAREAVYDSYKLQEDVHVNYRTYLTSGKDMEKVAVKVGDTVKYVPIWVINNMRSFLMQSFTHDEQCTIAMMERINANRRRPDPGLYSYGGVYVYSSGAFLYMASALGAVTLTSDISYYFLRPGELKKIFVALKLWGILFTSLTGFLVFYAGALVFNQRAGLFAALFYAVSPGIVIDSSVLKPYGFSLFWSMLAFIFMLLFVESGRRKMFYFASAVLGLTLGSIYIHVFMTPAFLAALYFARLRENKVRLLIKGCCIAAGVFIITNPYLLLNLDMFYHEFAYAAGSQPFTISLYKVGTYFLSTLPSEFSLGIYIFCLLGLVKIFSMRKPKMLVLCSAFVPAALYSSLSNYYLAHYSVTLVPFALVVAGFFADFLLSKYKTRGGLAIGAVLLVSIMNTGYYSYLWIKEDTRISAGKWINANVPGGSSIAASGSFGGVAGYPAFRFWDYELYPAQSRPLKEHIQYYIHSENEADDVTADADFNNNFREIWRGKNNIDFFETVFFGRHIMKNYGHGIIVYERE